jgi:hypothetical protein
MLQPKKKSAVFTLKEQNLQTKESSGTSAIKPDLKSAKEADVRIGQIQKVFGGGRKKASRINSEDIDGRIKKQEEDENKWENKKWQYAEQAASVSSLGNYIPHPAAQAVGKAGSAVGMALAARKAKIAYNEKRYLDMSGNLGMMLADGAIGSGVFKRASKFAKNDKLVGNFVDQSAKRTSYINVAHQVRKQSNLAFSANRASLGLVGLDLYNPDFNFKKEGVVNKKNKKQ